MSCVFPEGSPKLHECHLYVSRESPVCFQSSSEYWSIPADTDSCTNRVIQNRAASYRIIRICTYSHSLVQIHSDLVSIHADLYIFKQIHKHTLRLAQNHAASYIFTQIHTDPLRFGINSHRFVHIQADPYRYPQITPTHAISYRSTQIQTDSQRIVHNNTSMKIH